MPRKKKAPQPTSPDPIERDRLEEWQLLIDQYWRPYLPEMMIKLVELATQGSPREILQAVDLILTRMYGRPMEQAKIEGSLNIEIQFPIVGGAAEAADAQPEHEKQSEALIAPDDSRALPPGFSTASSRDDELIDQLVMRIDE